MELSRTDVIAKTFKNAQMYASEGHEDNDQVPSEDSDVRRFDFFISNDSWHLCC